VHFEVFIQKIPSNAYKWTTGASSLKFTYPHGLWTPHGENLYIKMHW
jgi:hypothetical protein